MRSPLPDRPRRRRASRPVGGAITRGIPVRPRRRRASRRPGTPALVAALVPVVFAALAAPGAVADEASDDCKPAKIDRWARVDYIHDGDTLWLDDGVKVRIIGLNAPELGREGSPGEPLAGQARDALRRWITGRVGLEYDAEKQDRYGRALAHVYSESRDNLAARLIARGLAFAVTFPPNLEHRRCYRQAEQAAHAAGAGVWSHAYFNPVPAAEVKRGGFMRVKGCVKSTRNTPRTRYLQLAPGFRLKIRRADLDGLPEPLRADLSGACLVARGWVYNDRRSHFKTLAIRHPDHVETLTPP